MSSEPQNVDPEANLVFFIHDRLKPALRHADKIVTSPNLISIYSSLDLLESFLWLHLGVTVGYFPQSLSRRVMYEYFVPMLKAYEAILETKLIDTWLAQPMRSILSEEFNGRAALLTVSERTAVLESINLSAIFQNVFLLANRFAQRGEAALLVTAISLASEPVWLHAASEAQSRDFLLDNGEDIQLLEEGAGWSYRGFFQTVEYMKAIPHLHRDAERTSEKWEDRERGALARLFEQLREVQQWRFNFGYPTPRERFLQIARSVAESLLKFTPFEEAPEEAVVRFQREILELLHYWGAPRSKTAGA